MNIPKHEKSIKEQVLEKAWDIIIEYLTSETVTLAAKTEAVKKLFRLKPATKTLQLIIHSEGKENSTIYDLKYKRSEYPELKVWRMDVFKRDGFKCVKCGSNKKIAAHHKKSWCKYPDLRFNIDNGETLCDKHHKQTHNYGIKAKYEVT